MREALWLRLESWGARVRAFPDIASFERALADGGERPDLVVTDHRLPDGTGVDLASSLRARPGHSASVLVVTGNTSPEDFALLQASGLSVLHKPFDAASLFAAVRTVLQERGP